ncbi:MAG: phosphomannomutase [Alphaproteobacteria bacterium CG_4_10_14_0_8_um_filter_53_9]|nr:MAG: phosphomannomutase [Alphaproteobacteria bacterium CG_4_10_14_0_8_um_filter_53_9]
MPSSLAAFKAYDVRGRVPEDLDERLVFTLGREVSGMLNATTAVVGYDAREESPALFNSLCAGLQAAGVNVFSLGMCGTEEVYHATGAFGHDVGIMVTASHNPKGYNGLKLIKADGIAFSGEDLKALEALVASGLDAAPSVIPLVEGINTLPDARDAYLTHILSMVSAKSLKPMKIVVNCMNGSAGPTLRALAERLPQMTWIFMQDEPDGTFPYGLPNPLLPEQRKRTADAIREHSADLGVAFDGDFDRCFVFDHEGHFVSPYYTLGLLVEALLPEHPGATIVHDPRLYWDTIDTIDRLGGTPAVSRGGHLFFKQKMRETGAIFGAEVSGHYFFKDFYYCDSGVLPFLFVLRVMSETGKTLLDLVAHRREHISASEETNFRLSAPVHEVLDAVRLATGSATTEMIDGLGFTFDTWRMNIRSSNTEPLLRLNIEAKDPETLVREHSRLLDVICAAGATLSDH